MNISSLVEPILKTPTQPFDFENPPFNAEEFAEKLVNIMQNRNGIGIAANQIGVPYSIFAIASDPIYVCFNPMIVHESEEQVLLEEGCLSFPDLFVKIKRPKLIRLRFADYNGNVHTFKFEGITARAIQHEMDHLKGELFFNKANKYHREKALSRYRK